MFDVPAIATAVYTRIGWREETRPDEAWGLEPAEPTVENHWQNAHPLLTLLRMQAMAPRFDESEADDTARDTAFAKWLKQKTTDGIREVLQDWKNESGADYQGVNVGNAGIQQMYTQGEKSLHQSEVTAGKRYGMVLKPSLSKQAVTTIRLVSVRAKTAATLTVKLWEEGNATALQEVEVEVKAAGVRVWVDANWKLEGGKVYFIGYEAPSNWSPIDESDVSMALAGRAWRKYYEAIPGSLEVGEEFTNQEVAELTRGTAYGFNLVTKTECELTSFVKDNIDRFTRALVLGVGMRLLREIAFNPEARTNRKLAKVDTERLLYEIDGDTRGRDTTSISARYRKELKQLAFSSAGADPICLTCKKRNGMRWKTVH
jgi:hypothetical protein